MQVDNLKAFEQRLDGEKMVADLLAPQWGDIYWKFKFKFKFFVKP